MTRTTIKVMAALCAVTQSLPVGTNPALLQLLWMLLSGQLLPSSMRGTSPSPWTSPPTGDQPWNDVPASTTIHRLAKPYKQSSLG